MAKFFSNDPGAYIATTGIFDTQNIQGLNINSDEFKRFLVTLQTQVNNLSLLLNIKDTGYYSTQEFICGQSYFQDPSSSSGQSPVEFPVVRKVIEFGALPNAGTKNVAHNIDFTSTTTLLTRLYGASTDQANNRRIPLPYSSPTLNENILLEQNGANITVTTGINYSTFTQTFIVIEYITVV